MRINDPAKREAPHLRLDRDALIAAGICVACLVHEAAEHSVHCRECRHKVSMADAHAFKGFYAETQAALFGRKR